MCWCMSHWTPHVVFNVKLSKCYISNCHRIASVLILHVFTFICRGGYLSSWWIAGQNSRSSRLEFSKHYKGNKTPTVYCNHIVSRFQLHIVCVHGVCMYREGVYCKIKQMIGFMNIYKYHIMSIICSAIFYINIIWNVHDQTTACFFDMYM